jgi:hypothetical protein
MVKKERKQDFGFLSKAERDYIFGVKNLYDNANYRRVLDSRLKDITLKLVNDNRWMDFIDDLYTLSDWLKSKRRYEELKDLQESEAYALLKQYANWGTKRPKVKRTKLKRKASVLGVPLETENVTYEYRPIKIGVTCPHCGEGFTEDFGKHFRGQFFGGSVRKKDSPC